MRGSAGLSLVFPRLQKLHTVTFTKAIWRALELIGSCSESMASLFESRTLSNFATWVNQPDEAHGATWDQKVGPALRQTFNQLGLDFDWSRPNFELTLKKL